MITWNGTTSDSLGIFVEYYPERIKPAKKANIVSVPGRNGNIILDTDSYENVIQEYEIYISENRPVNAADIATWLYSPIGYKKLSDNYDSTHFRLAYYIGETNIESIFNRFGRATLQFSCKPQRFLNTGETVTTLTSSGSIVNPTAFASLPIIKITGSGTINLNIGGQVIKIVIDSGNITLDCEMQNAYKGTTNLNSKVTGAFPKLASGSNAISWSGGTVTKIEITPRWWEL